VAASRCLICCSVPTSAWGSPVAARRCEPALSTQRCSTCADLILILRFTCTAAMYS